MADVPKKSAQLFFPSHVKMKTTAARRIVNPSTGFQYEILAEEVDYVCPICKTEQPAPVNQNTEYFCPTCDWRYLIQGQSLWIWHPSSVGVKTEALAPGTHRTTLIDGQDTGELDALEEGKRASARWRQAVKNNEEDSFGKKTQILTVEKKGGDERR